LFREMLVGSVTTSLVSLADLPVLIVKELNAKLDINTILVAYDGSKFSKKALELALEISKAMGSKVVAAKVFEPIELAGIYSSHEEETDENLMNKLDKLRDIENEFTDEINAAAKEKDVDVEIAILQGNAVESIIRCARECDADMIAVGTKGHGKLEAMLLGSVTQGIMNMSIIPVLVVK